MRVTFGSHNKHNDNLKCKIAVSNSPCILIHQLQDNCQKLVFGDLGLQNVNLSDYYIVRLVWISSWILEETDMSLNHNKKCTLYQGFIPGIYLCSM